MKAYLSYEAGILALEVDIGHAPQGRVVSGFTFLQRLMDEALVVSSG